MENINLNPKKIYLKDYKSSFFFIENVEIEFFLDLENTRVRTSYIVKPNPDFLEKCHDLILNGEKIELKKFLIDGKVIDSNKYVLTKESLTIPSFPGGLIELETTINPSKNTDLSGLYASDSGLYTQCEAEGFRNITYFIDRPDILAKYKVHLHANKSQFPILLSNGNLIEESFNEKTKILSRTWEDPFPKPCYLFALVAADLSLYQEKLTLACGKEVLLQFYTQKKDIKKIHHALDALKYAINWDEERNDLKLDLDRYMIVAVPDFNSGAMENKGLNLFNTKYVLADKNISTDQDYESITAVIGHEYFHNWTGNRVTCRDWFQLTLKEGLTVFREQEFVTDFNAQNLSLIQAKSAGAVKRIEDVRILREKQFPEDASPMSHPIRPGSYSEISNFYTTTIYEKGAEVIRMLHTIFGEDGFQKGMKNYITNFDGLAATCENFVSAILQENDRLDLFHIFMRWYDSKGTPCVEVVENWDSRKKNFSITFEQKNPDGSRNTKPLLIPIKYKFINLINLCSNKSEELILLTESKKTISFEFPYFTADEKPFISLFRNFSSPVNVIRNISSEDALFQLKNDCDLFNRWDAAQKLYILTLLEVDNYKQEKYINQLTEGIKETLISNKTSDAFKTTVLTPPSDGFIGEKLTERNVRIDPKFIFERKAIILKTLANNLIDELTINYNKIKLFNETNKYNTDTISIGKRKLKNLIQQWLCQIHTTSDWQAQIQKKFFESTNMTDRVENLKSLTLLGSKSSDKALQFFYQNYQSDPIVLDKWIALQIESKDFFSHNTIKILDVVKRFLNEDFFNRKNPNRVQAVLGTFFFKNLKEFHQYEESYEIWSSEILKLDKCNPQLAARLTRSFDGWQNFELNCRENMQFSLKNVLSKATSKDVIEVASRLLKKS